MKLAQRAIAAMESMEKAFSVKRHKKEGANSASSDVPGDSGTEDDSRKHSLSDDRQTAQWVSKALSSALMEFGSEVEAQFEARDKRLASIEEELSKKAATDIVDKQIAALTSQMEAMRLEISEVKESVKKDVDAHLKKNVTLGSRSNVSTASTDAPRTTVARIGRIGWDMADNELIKVAEAILKDAGVPPGDWHSLTAVRDVGSMAEVIFKDHQSLEIAGGRVKALKRTISPATLPVWLAPRRSAAEQKPRRLYFRAKEYLIDMLDHTARGISFDDRGRRFMINDGQRILAYCLSDRIFIVPASSRGILSAEEEEEWKAYAASQL